MELTTVQMTELAMLSINAEKENKEIEQLTLTYPDLTEKTAYQIQKIRNEILVNEGKKIIGGKLGATSKAKLMQIGASGPSYGQLFDYMMITEGEALESEKLIHPRVEGELAFVLKQDLYGANITSLDVMLATDYVCPALEIIDSRYLDFKFKNPDSISDNISAAKFKLSAARKSPTELNMIDFGVKMNINGEYTGFGAGGAVMGHPARAVSFFVRSLYRAGMGLRAGDIILSGAIIASRNIYKGDHIRCDFENLGFVELDVI